MHLSFLLSSFESGFRCSRNGGLPVIWIISLYLFQVYFVIIIVEFLVTVLSIEGELGHYLTTDGSKTILKIATSEDNCHNVW